MNIKQFLTYASLIGLTVFPVSLPVLVQAPIAQAQAINSAVIFDPPSNVRTTPNGSVLCTVESVTMINVYGVTNGWYETDVCGNWGYIHQSQIRLQSNNQVQQPTVFCDVVNIQSGQLALRFSPGGQSRAGLDNGNVVSVIKTEDLWFYVRVIQGPNSNVNGLEGWVNSNYLSCYEN